MGVPRGQKGFLNMVMWHIKLTGMTSRRESKYASKNNHPRVKMVTFG